MHPAIQEETLRAMLEAGAVRDVLVSRQDDKWTWAIRLGRAGSRWLPVHSRREALRTWASLTAVGQFAESSWIRGALIEDRST
ncbi:hypothetical protein [Pseudomonas sp. Irchel 3A5]|uniref:hypothetical protein n=1 Tax=Pseudomonas sp. Irchel 3A5 TaxID=2008911 RepID=UPI000BA43F25|nr:hypothetical protein [Pseudomonas sp. Irchel 3A5]